MTTHRRLMSLALVLCLMLTMIPGPFGASRAENNLGMTTTANVNVRYSASTSSPFIFKLPSNYVCTITGETDADGIHWFKVRVITPETGSTREYDGYIHGDFFRRLTDEEASQYRPGDTVGVIPSGAGNVDTEVTGTYGVVTNSGTNLREGPGTQYYSMMKLDRGTEVEILSVPSVISSETFYKVRLAGERGLVTGYIMSTFIRVTSSSGTPTPTAAPTGGSVTPTPTPVPTGSGGTTPTPAPTSYSGYTHVRLILTSCHLRESPNGNFDSDNDWEGRGSVLPLAGDPVNSGGYAWYPVSRNGRVWYVRNDCVQPFSEGGTTATPVPSGVPTAVPTSVPTADPGVLGTVRTIVSAVNLRATPGGAIIKRVDKNREFNYTNYVSQGGYTWYYVTADGDRGYLRGDTVTVTSVNPTATPTGSGTVTPTPAPDNTPEGSSGYVRTIASSVNLRRAAGYTSILGKVDKDVVMPYYSITGLSGVDWYYVRHPSLGFGYIHNSFITLTDANGNEIATVTPTNTSSTTGSSSQREASYSTLRIGSTGTAVRNLVTALKNKGYYKGEVTNKYTSAVAEAVKDFQRAMGLTVDGVAGAATQHKLFGTVPIGASDASNLTMTLYPAEKIDWYSGGINEMWARGANYKVYDVKTGIVWWAHRWAGGSHVDAEPLTAADTARLCKSYGVTTAQEIADKNLYQRRPLLVTIGTRTFACSLYGVPHNYPEGDTISDNDFKGQVCIHFSNSHTHNSNKVDSGHEEAIQYAWEHAPNGHK